MFYTFVKNFCNVIKYLFGIRLKRYGIENIPKDGAFIMASNHTSYLDPMAIPMVCPRQMSFMVRDTLLHKPVLGPFLKGLSCFPVKRGSSDVRAIRTILEKLESGRPVLLFPQGSRHKEKQSLKAGVGLVAVKSGCPVVPIYVKGADKVLPPGGRWPKPGIIEVYFGHPVMPEENEDIHQFSQRVMVEVEALYAKV